ncbi:MAG TPA: transglutaminase family protein [Xanthobacteraceae bacterium]|nr:transglutaminase family protein [Xanthobacteraceae bacterium]
MRLRIAHSTVYRYDPPASGAIQVLRLSPRNHDGQYVVRWRIDVFPDARLAAHEDAFGNMTHVFTADGPLEELRVEVDGEVETQNADGIVRGTIERFPPNLFLRDTALTQADAGICAFAETIRTAGHDGALGELHGLLDGLHAELAHEPHPHDTGANAAKAFERKSGTATDLAHIFIGAAHSLGIPARFVAGYFRQADAGVEQSGHAWAEAYVPDLGWIAFDPANGFCPTDAHVRVAVGLDALGAAPLRGTRYGAGAEALEIAIKVGQ